MTIGSNDPLAEYRGRHYAKARKDRDWYGDIQNGADRWVIVFICFVFSAYRLSDRSADLKHRRCYPNGGLGHTIRLLMTTGQNSVCMGGSSTYMRRGLWTPWTLFTSQI